MAAHLYWRLNIAEVDGGTLISIAEIEMRIAIAGANVATGGTATASAQQVGSEASKAFDANNATNWLITAAVKQGWIQYQFATAQDIIEHTITAPAATMTNAPKNHTIQWSDDNLNWTTTAIVGGQTGWTTNEKRVFTHSSYPVTIGVGTMLANMLPANTQTVPAATFNAVLRGDQIGGRVYTGPTKYITGIVKQESVNVSRIVRAYHRKTGEVLGETTSNASTGAFSLVSMGWTDQCYVLALDDLTASPDFNAVISDLVVPV